MMGGLGWGVLSSHGFRNGLFSDRRSGAAQSLFTDLSALSPLALCKGDDGIRAISKKRRIFE
jgi:hypothetical protein